MGDGRTMIKLLVAAACFTIAQPPPPTHADRNEHPTPASSADGSWHRPRKQRSLHSNPSAQLSDIALPVRLQNVADKCLPKFSCDPLRKYRSLDGTCNNLRVSTWGSANTAFVRLLPAAYADGVNALRLSRNGNFLPSARLLHTALFADANRFDFGRTLAVMEWGQIIAHDVTFLSTKTGPPCCTANGNFIGPRDSHPACMPIFVPTDDPFYFRFRRTCLAMKRAKTASDVGCELKPVQQISRTTHWLDGSHIYGRDEAASNALRTFRGGLLRVQLTADRRPFPLNHEKPTRECNVASDSDVCYVAGDSRVNQNAEIAVSTVAFMRLHNSLANELSAINPDWTDQTLFQEARRIVIAILQHITYAEYLPILLGSRYTATNNLGPASHNYAFGYDPNINPSSINEFVGAAFRSLHSSVQGFISLVNESRALVGELRFSDLMSRPGLVQAPGNLDNFLRGLITQPQQSVDSFFSGEISNFLFKGTDAMGSDLLAMDIQRGRDMGIPPYTTMRTLCGLPPVNRFEDLTDVIDEQNVIRLSRLYSNVHDVDYLVGGLLERAVPGATTTPSFHCVLAEAFHRYKFADRFFYEFGDQPGSFTLDQLNTIRRVTLSMVICLVGDNVRFAQPNGFAPPNPRENPLVACSQLVSGFNLHAWST